jgi:TusA-related sulfurtransferase
VLEVETAISKLDITKQQHYRHMVTETIKKINQQDNINNINAKTEWKLARNKLVENELTITKADEGKTIVILFNRNLLTKKLNNFAQENRFTLLNNNPTQNYQKTRKLIIAQCNNIIPKENKWKYTNMNPPSSPKSPCHNKTT